MLRFRKVEQSFVERGRYGERLPPKATVKPLPLSERHITNQSIKI
jgi:hypothetical protein